MSKSSKCFNIHFVVFFSWRPMLVPPEVMAASEAMAVAAVVVLMVEAHQAMGGVTMIAPPRLTAA